MASRKLSDLHPEFQPRVMHFLERCNSIGFDIVILCTYRSWIEQEKIFGLGRSLPGKKVTESRPGASKHNNMMNGRPASLAIDILPIKDGKPITNVKDPVWGLLGDIAKDCKIDWLGDHPRYPEINHFQITLHEETPHPHGQK
jgi:peptidoglycan L-alanyl-D-glutamate endopeptidase CwlK